jgi:ubiquinone/menaquinone biosynthesis C-methylase UbiE
MSDMLDRLICNAFLKFNISIRRINKSKDWDLELYKELYDNNALKNKRFYNVGAGPEFFHPCWTNIDYQSEFYPQSNIGINFDLTCNSPFPIDDNVAEVVYSSNTIEHIPDSSVQNMFNESYRILKKNGYIRITAPDIDLYYRALRENDLHFYWWRDMYSSPEMIKRSQLKSPMNSCSLKQVFLVSFAGQTSTLVKDPKKVINDDEFDRIFGTMSFEDALDYCVSFCTPNFGYHMNWFSKQKVIDMLKKAGFSKIVVSGYGQSYCPVMRNTNMFDHVRPKESFYIESQK